MKRATEIAAILRVARPTPLMGSDFDRFYIDADQARGKSSILYLRDYLSNLADVPQRILFTGHRGSGKTTELWRLSQFLHDRFWISRFSVKEELDPLDLTYVDLTFIIIEQLIAQAQKDGLKINERIAQRIWDWMADIKEIQTIIGRVESEGAVGVNLLAVLLAELKSAFKVSKETKKEITRHVEPRLSTLLDNCNMLIQDLTNQVARRGLVPLMIVEDLDKLEPSTARELFINHSAVLLSFQMHIIYTVPIFMLYSTEAAEILDHFDLDEILPVIKVHQRAGHEFPYPEGVDTIRRIVGRRVDLSLIEEEALDLMIAKSGGCLRDLFDVLQRAALFTLRQKGAQIDKEAVQEGLKELRSRYERSISERREGNTVIVSVQDYYARLAEISRSPTKQPDNDLALMDLLHSLAVLEYNGERWCDVHPIVMDILRSRGLIP